MSERANDLRNAICGALVDAPHPEGDDVIVARAICEHLGISWADVAEVQPTPVMCVDSACDQCRPARALATLLEAASIETPEQP